MTENKMVGWHHGLNGHEFEQAQGDSEGQGSLIFCSPSWKELDMTELLNNNREIIFLQTITKFTENNDTVIVFQVALIFGLI